MAPLEVVLATSNAGKVNELRALLQPLGINVSPQSSLGVCDVVETGHTFIENALLKARNAAAQSGLPAIADDSGLSVDVLHGAPGIYSARYAGAGASERANVDKLLMELTGVPEDQRSARFHCVLVYLRHPQDPIPVVCHTSWEGQVLLEPRGENGFGYDPIFYVPTHGCSSAELPPAIKNDLSHRGQALRALLRRLEAMGQRP
jgi:XTP/dITP diphosphohydrolase